MARAAAARGAVKLGRKAIRKMANKPVGTEPESNVKVVAKKVYDRSARGRKPTKAEEAASYKKEHRAAVKEAESRRTKGTPATRKKKLDALAVDRSKSSKNAKKWLEENQPRRRRRRAERAAARSGATRATKRTSSKKPRVAFVDPRAGGSSS